MINTRGQDPVPRLAVSVVMLRDSAKGIEVFVQHRASTMDFAAGVIAFPGGRVDVVDSSGWEYSAQLLKEHGAAWGQTPLAGDPARITLNAGRLLAAAVREVGEECGICLAPDALMPWANWVTPEGFPKRFDTYFFATTLSAEVEPLHQTTEASHSQWLPVAQLVRREASPVPRLLPPTMTILDELLRAGTAARALEVKRTIESVRLRPEGVEEFYRLSQTVGPSEAARALSSPVTWRTQPHS
jgi:8-oxo-dGTP pyrophosphatase MutT (NUDIX family)